MRIFITTLLSVANLFTFAQEDSLLLQEYRAYYAYVDSLESQLGYESGLIRLNNLATVNLPDGYRYLPPEETNRILVESWGNPPAQTLGMIVPPNINPYSFEGWGVVITYEQNGHIDDEDALQLDFSKLMDSMKEEVDAENEIRLMEGFEPYALKGWAEEPQYNPENHKLSWALELAFGEPDEAISTLNYNIRILGRNGVLVLNAVSGMEHLSDVKMRMSEIQSFTAFVDGFTYSDFDPDADRMAMYGISTLVTGNPADQMNFSKVALRVIAFGWKYFILLFAGTGLWLFRRWKVRNQSEIQEGTA